MWEYVVRKSSVQINVNFVKRLKVSEVCEYVGIFLPKILKHDGNIPVVETELCYFCGNCMKFGLLILKETDDEDSLLKPGW